MKNAKRIRLVAIGAFLLAVAAQAEATPIVLKSSKAVSVASVKGQLVGGGTLTDEMTYVGPAWPSTVPASVGAGSLVGGDETGEAVDLFAGVMDTIGPGYLSVESRAEANWYGGPPSPGAPAFDMQRTEITAFGMLQWIFRAPAGITARGANGAGYYGGEGIVALTDLTTGVDVFRTHTRDRVDRDWVKSEAELDEGHVYRAKIISRTTGWDDEWIPVEIHLLDAAGNPTSVQVPEPGTLGLLVGGLLALGLVRRRSCFARRMGSARGSSR